MNAFHPFRWLLAALMLCGSGLSLAQNYPDRPITIIVPFAAGGPADVVAREVGQVLARESVSVPDTLLFRAGGDDSVRGYAYRSLGTEIAGVTTGARSVATGSLELAHALPVRVQGLQGAIFADAGDAADRFSKMSIKRGYGLGVRWRSPVGPFRLDVAYGEAVQQWRLHFSVGVSL